MNIALCHYRVGETDGVSLEMDKWKNVLENLGHNVCFLSGSSGNADSHVIEELSLSDAYMDQLHYNCFYNIRDFNNDTELFKELHKCSERVQSKLDSFVVKNNIDLLIPNNILSLGHHLPVAMAFSSYIRKSNINAICHHHDFYWERDVFRKTTSRGVKEILEMNVPPSGKNISHVVINKIAQKSLLKKKNIDSVVIPNVFDFDQSPWGNESHSKALKNRLGINGNDIVILQATRITDRKAIELAIDFVALVNSEKFRSRYYGEKLYNGNIFDRESRILFLLPGLSGKVESSTGYDNKIFEYAVSNSVNLIRCNNLIEDDSDDKNLNDDYTLWDFYSISDFITYPSILEGWGNQFLEGVFAKKPMLIFEYPVFLSDIRKNGFKYISLGSQFNRKSDGLCSVDFSTLAQSAEKSMRILFDSKRYSSMTETNFEIARENYSLQCLTGILTDSFEL